MKVFLVDDEIVVREGIRESFPWDRTPYTLVGEAPDGEMALPMIRDTNPDIVITDIKMPFMDGLELCRSLRTQMPWIGIIVLSGYDEFEYARQCIQLVMMHTGAANATNAAGMEMNAIASSIIGGTLLTGGVGNVIGTFFGTMTLTTIKKIVVSSGLNAPWWQSITTGGMLCFFILLQSVVLSQRARKKKA